MPGLTLINSTDLNNWSVRIDSQSQLPKLVRRLVYATAPKVLRLGFPADEGVQLGGWDGMVEVTEGNSFVPNGTSVWELGTNTDVKGKADSDFEKRSENPGAIDPKTTTFVFVTSRRWGNKDKWVEDRRKEQKWLDVRAYDAEDLATWLELAPSVHVWISTLLGKHPDGAVDLSSFWDAWAKATRVPLSAEFAIGGREEVREELVTWLRSTSQSYSLQAATREDAVAFLAASLGGLDPDERDQFFARCVIAETPSALRHLSSAASSLIIVPNLDDRAYAVNAMTAGHRVFIPLGGTDPSVEGVTKLPNPGSDSMKTALIRMGLSEAQADDLGALASHSLTAFRRKQSINPVLVSPKWAEPANARSLVPVLLIGSWNDGSKADREVVSRLAQRDYAEVVNNLVRWATESDAPVRKVGDIWMLVSLEDAWMLLARFLVSDDLSRLQEIILDVFGQADPQYDLPPANRWAAEMFGKKLPHSSDLRKGLAETLAIAAAFEVSNPLTGPLGSQAWASSVVNRLFTQTGDWVAWASLSEHLPLLAEAAPDQFLDAVDRALSGDHPLLLDLFTDKDASILGCSSPHTGLLWALEIVAWSPDHVARASHLLARLARIDPGGKLMNRPLNSLRNILLSWHPNTLAALDQRLKVVDLIRKKEPQVATKLLPLLLPDPHSIGSFNPTPRWRRWVPNDRLGVTYADIDRTTEEIVNRLVADAGNDGEKWRDLIDRLGGFSPRDFDTVARSLGSLDIDVLDANDRHTIWDRLRTTVASHSEFPQAQWAMPKERIDRIASIREHFLPSDPSATYAWLFSHRPRLGEPINRDWKERERLLLEQRKEAVKTLFSAGGLDLLIELASTVENPWALGNALGQCQDLSVDEDAILSRTLDSDIGQPLIFGVGYLKGRSDLCGEGWMESRRISKSVLESSSLLKANFYRCLPFEDHTWDLLEENDSVSQQLYWQRVDVFGRGSLEGISCDRAVAKLIEHRRLVSAVEFIAMYAVDGQVQVPARLTADVLAGIVRGESDESLQRLDPYEIDTLLKSIETSDEIKEEDIARFELFFLPILDGIEHSTVHLHQLLSRDPEIFSEVIAWTYKAENGDPGEPTEQQITFARLGFELLQSWKIPPGVVDGSIDEVALETWVRRARELCSSNGRAAVGDRRIGEVLVLTPTGSDGIWPHEAVRELLEELASEEIERGLLQGILNGRGVVSRSVGEGGNQERGIAEGYRQSSESLRDRWPRSARLAGKVCEMYTNDARQEDIRAELDINN